jgi:putative Mn2+ efflux pump MntP
MLFQVSHGIGGFSMKKRGIFSGIILIGFGLYFLLERFSLFSSFHTWPTLLLIIGIAFLGQAYIGKDYHAILSGVVFTGIGVHFHLSSRLSSWPDDISALTFIVAIGLFMQYVKTKQALLPTILLFALSVIFLFSQPLQQAFTSVTFDSLIHIWPLAFILLGLYLLFVKKG